jgi:preprotein translocase subunit SecF
MEFFRIRKDIPFMRHALVFNVISLVTFLLAVFFLINKGLHFSIEFTGGTLLEVSYAQAPDLDKLRKQMEADGFTDTQVQNFGTSRDVLIRVPISKDAETSKVGERVMASLARVGASGDPKVVQSKATAEVAAGPHPQARRVRRPASR